MEVAGEVDAVAKRAPGGVEMPAQVFDTLDVVDAAIGVDVVLGGAAVLGDVEREPGEVSALSVCSVS